MREKENIKEREKKRTGIKTEDTIDIDFQKFKCKIDWKPRNQKEFHKQEVQIIIIIIINK